jgi:hypothetical protein
VVKATIIAVIGLDSKLAVKASLAAVAASVATVSASVTAISAVFVAISALITPASVKRAVILFSVTP